MLLRFAAASPRPLVAAMPGGTAVRLAVEADLGRRGWAAARSPAEADLLVVAGSSGPAGSPLASAVEQTWRMLPAPRARVCITAPDDVPAALTRARRQLADVAEQRAAAASRGPGDGRDEDERDTESPAGLPMAERGEDRDGLRLDRLHVPLGPLLADWPAGLVVNLTLQGDVIQEAGVATTAEADAGMPFWREPWLRAATGGHVQRGTAARREAAGYLDSLARLLAVAGWEAAAVRARALRYDALAGTPGLRRRTERFTRRVRRSRTLHWMISGLGVVAADATADPRLAGDAAARCARWLRATRKALDHADDRAPLRPDGPADRSLSWTSTAAALEVLPGSLEGCDLAAARLVVASLDPDLAELGRWAEAVGD